MTIHNINVARRHVEIGALYETPEGEFVFARRHIKRGKTQCTHVGTDRVAGTFWPSELKLAVSEVQP